ELVQAGQRGDLVALGERRIVEDVIDEVAHRTSERHHGLADVYELGRAFADDVDAQDLPRLLMEEQLEPARGVANDLAARDLTVVRHARLVGYADRGEVLLGTAHEGDLRDGVEPVREEPRRYRGLQAEGAGRGDAALLHGHGGEAREADH